MSTRKTLLLITTSYPRWSNGREAAGSFVSDLAGELAEHACVRVVAPGDTEGLENVTPHLTVYRYPAPRRRLVNLRPWNPLDAWRILRTLRAGQIAARRATADGHIRHMLALWALPSGQWARAVGRRTGVPYSVWMLGSDVWTLGRLPVVRSILRGVMRDAQRRYADGLELARESEAICDRTVAFLPTTRALETHDAPQPAGEAPYRLVFIGRWHRNKGIDLFLDALAVLDDAEWARIGEVAIYGGGPLQTEVRTKERQLLEAGRPLKVGGFIPKAEAERAIVRSDWVVIPSRIESIPVIFSDAMKLGRPVIATPVGDLPGLVREGPCGVLAAAATGEAFAEAIRGAMRSSAKAFSVGVSVQSKRFDLAAIAAAITREVLAGE